MRWYAPVITAISIADRFWLFGWTSNSKELERFWIHGLLYSLTGQVVIQKKPVRKGLFPTQPGPHVWVLDCC